MHGITKHIPLLILALYSCTAGAATIQTESKQAGIAGGLELDTYAASASASKAVPIYHSMQKLTGFSAANGVLTSASLSVSGSVWGGQGISGMVDSRIITPSQDANGRITRALDMRIGDRQYSLGSNSVDVRCVGANTYLCPYQDSFTDYGVRQSVAVEDLNLFVNDAGINFGRTGTVELFGTVTTEVLSVDYVGSRLSPGLTHVVGAMNGLFQVQANYEYLQHAAASFNADTDVSSLTIDFGTVKRGADASQSFTLYNLAGERVGLDLDEILGTGDLGAFSNNLAGFAGLGQGRGGEFLANLDTSRTGKFGATYELRLSDADVGVASTRTGRQLTLNFLANVVDELPTDVPEPGSLALVCIGALGLLASARSKITAHRS